MTTSLSDSRIYHSADALIVVIGPGSQSEQLTQAVEILEQASLEPCHQLVLDVGNVNRVSSELLALLLWAKVRLQARGAQLTVARPSPTTREMMSRTGLDHILVVLDELPAEEAA